MANDWQILNEKLITMLVYEAMVRKIRGTSEPFNTDGCQPTCRLVEKRRLFFLYFALYYPPVLNNT